MSNRRRPTSHKRPKPPTLIDDVSLNLSHAELCELPAAVLLRIGTPAARRASLAKRQAAHEAGHVWAASRMGLSFAASSITGPGDPLSGADDAQTAFLALAGVMAEGVYTVVDTYVVDTKGGLLRFGPDFRLEVPSGFEPGVVAPAALGRVSGPQFRYSKAPMNAHVHDPNLYWQWMQKALVNRGCVRGGDDTAAHLLLSEVDSTTNLPPMLADWELIERVAQELVLGASLTREQVETLLTP